MYQRLGLVDVVAVAVSFIFLEPSGSDAEHEGNDNTDQLIRHQKKNRGYRHHEKYHAGGNRRLPARWPGHFACLLTHFLQEAEGADPLASHLCRRLVAHMLSLNTVAGPLGRSGGTRTPNPRFWRPVL